MSIRSWEWKPGSDENCFNESHPIQGPHWGTGSNLDIMQILHHTLTQLQVEVILLNITQLSEYRKDAHTSIYGERKGKLLTKEQRANPKAFADCIHWCLPGVPDTWNLILYAYLLKTFQNFSWPLKHPNFDLYVISNILVSEEVLGFLVRWFCNDHYKKVHRDGKNESDQSYYW